MAYYYWYHYSKVLRTRGTRALESNFSSANRNGMQTFFLAKVSIEKIISSKERNISNNISLTNKNLIQFKLRDNKLRTLYFVLS